MTIISNPELVRELINDPETPRGEAPPVARIYSCCSKLSGSRCFKLIHNTNADPFWANEETSGYTDIILLWTRTHGLSRPGRIFMESHGSPNSRST